jgi:hypothetical protein
MKKERARQFNSKKNMKASYSDLPMTLGHQRTKTNASLKKSVDGTYLPEIKVHVMEHQQDNSMLENTALRK